MNLADIVFGPWAITPEMHREIFDIYQRHLRGEAADFEKIEASIGRKLDNETKPYRVIDRVAVLPMIGVIAKRANFFMRISGGVSTQLLSRDFGLAMDDPGVSAVVIEADTPGGAVDGTPEFAEQVFLARGRKPILVWSDGMMASAGTWIGTAADKVYISSEVVLTGSIGVVSGHRDISKREESRGVKTTEITAGKYKRIASSYAPLSDEGKADIQAVVNHIYGVFVDTVARNRGMSVEDVLAKAADGRDFLGKQGIEAGLVDGIKTFDEVLEEARRMAAGTNNFTPQLRGGGDAVDAKELAEKYPEAVGDIRVETEKVVLGGLTGASVMNSAPSVAAELQEAGAVRERERIIGVRAQSMPGHEALIAGMELDGKSTASDAAIAIVSAEKEVLANAQAHIKDGSNPPVDPPQGTENGGGEKTMKRAEWDALSGGERGAFIADGGQVI